MTALSLIRIGKLDRVKELTACPVERTLGIKRKGFESITYLLCHLSVIWEVEIIIYSASSLEISLRSQEIIRDNGKL